MARASDFSYQQLEWAWEQLCREDTLTAASGSLVDYHHQLPLAQEWGAGRLSSSDGQRFAARTRGPGVAPLPRYFGHRRRGLQIYSWTSDQYSQYASKVVTATVRDATHTLDGILDNQTVLPIEEHTTDTHGFTEMIFGAYDLLGLRFAPEDPRSPPPAPLPPRHPAGRRDRRAAQEQDPPRAHPPYWDELLRLAASLRHGWAPASLLLARLQAGSRRNPLAQALQEYGRLIKTNFILVWLADEELRRGSAGSSTKASSSTPSARDLLRERRSCPAAHARTTGRAGALPGDRRQRDHRLEHRLHQPRPRRTPRRRRANHHQRDRTHLPARPPAHPPLRPLPLRHRQPTQQAPAAPSPHIAGDADHRDAEPRLTQTGQNRAVTNEGPRGRARGPSTRTRARLPAPPAARRGRRQWRGGDRRRRSRPRPDRQRLGAARAARRASHRRSGRSPHTAAACSPRRPGPRSAAPRGNRLRSSRPGVSGGEGRGPSPPATRQRARRRRARAPRARARAA